MAYVFPSNQQALKDIHWRQASTEGREFDGRFLLSELAFPNAWGDSFPLLTIINGIERRVAQQNAAIAALTDLVAATAKNPDITVEQITAAIKAAVGDFEITLKAG